MKALRRILVSFALVFVALITLASCSNATQSYADKINKRYSEGNAITYEDAVADLGDECINVTVAKNGVLVAINGYTKDNYEEKLNSADENTKFKFIVITVVTGKCTYAHYATGSAGEVKAALNIKK